MAKIPPSPKNNKPAHPGPNPIGDREFEDLTDEEQVATLNHELQMWTFEGLNVHAVPHNIFNMDTQLQALVRYVITELGGDEAAMNRCYRKMAYEKLTSIRSQSRKGSNIIVPKKPGLEI